MSERDIDRRRGGGWGCLKAALALILILAAIGAGFWYLGDRIRGSFMGGPDPVTVAQSSLQGLREQNRLTTFSGSYVAVVTSKQTRLGLTAQKTMIMPGTVRYEVDLSKLSDRDLTWDPATRKLTLVLPPIEVIGPEVNIDGIRSYGNGGILMTFTDAEQLLDDANRKAGQEELLRQARSPMYMRLARQATRRAVENSFLMPLRAVGVQATVEVKFLDEVGKPTERWDESRRPEDVLSNRW
ncbi:DUF4230 domain-containing protein [Sphingomonas sp. LB-2]|uniref:DUF4230 domain-containing protein n=1 Tax=Sphingomonas caeni TaxID=2984949 RepID=UPI0022301CDA|nr:DUF4230 domain-containing protein [Sphingomonas caeni]MCW3845710.1 DUF4230 domain-containing protein [Sphingomonas caeni]